MRKLLLGLLIWAGALWAAPPDDLAVLATNQWYQFSNSQLGSSGVLANNPSHEACGTSGNVAGVMYAWSSGAWDSSRNQLLIFGGGHCDYDGNEVYAFSVPTGTWSRLTSNTTTNPISVHTYDALDYIPAISGVTISDVLVTSGGSAAVSSGGWTNQHYTLDLSTNTWTARADLPGTAGDSWTLSMTGAWDTNSEKWIVRGENYFMVYDPKTDTWTTTLTGSALELYMSAEIDPIRKKYVEIGAGTTAKMWDIPPDGVPTNLSSLSATGATQIESCKSPGMTWDSQAERITAYCHTDPNALYTLDLTNPSAPVWTRHPIGGTGPSDPSTSHTYGGTFGRLRYMPAYNAFIVVLATDQNVYAVKLTAGSGSGGGGSTDDWTLRSTSPDVVYATRFDNMQTDFCDRLFPKDDGTCSNGRGSFYDTSVKASGNGSVRFDVKTEDPYWSTEVMVSINDYAQQFGGDNPGYENMWLQWRQRWNSYMISHQYPTSSGAGQWKQILVTQGLLPGDTDLWSETRSCPRNQLTISNINGRKYPQAFHTCWDYINITSYVSGITTRMNWGDESGNQGASPWKCPYTGSNLPNYLDPNTCFWYEPDKWYTFMIHLQMGPDGSAVDSLTGQTVSGFINSTFEFYGAPEGEAFQLLHKKTGMVVRRGFGASTSIDDSSIARYGIARLTPFITAKIQEAAGGVGQTWYDEVIFSKAAIPAPTGTAPGNPPDTTPPDAPTNIELISE